MYKYKNKMRKQMIEVLLSKWKAERDIAKENISVYLTSSAGIGEHSDIMEALELQVKKFNDADDMVESLTKLITAFN
jgi:hypothetical protein